MVFRRINSVTNKYCYIAIMKKTFVVDTIICARSNTKLTGSEMN